MAKATLTLKQKKALLSKGRKQTTALNKTKKGMLLLQKKLNQISGIARSGTRRK
jgi:hypothetical protein